MDLPQQQQPQLAQTIIIRVVNDFTDTEGLNTKSILCPKCSSIILKPNIATLCDATDLTTDPNLDATLFNKGNEEQIDELNNTLWCVEDIFKFENMGFSHTVNEFKYLCCADCESGPVGWHNIQSKYTFVCPNKVVYQ